MASYSFSQFRRVLKHYGFTKKREGSRHEWWEKVTESGIRLVPIKRKQADTIPRGLFHDMLEQACLSLEEFREGL